MNKSHSSHHLNLNSISVVPYCWQNNIFLFHFFNAIEEEEEDDKDKDEDKKKKEKKFKKE